MYFSEHLEWLFSSEVVVVARVDAAVLLPWSVQIIALDAVTSLEESYLVCSGVQKAIGERSRSASAYRGVRGEDSSLC